MNLNKRKKAGLILPQQSKKSGLSPGTLMVIGSESSEPVKVTLIEYSEEGVVEKMLINWEECAAYKNTPNIKWLNVEGIHDTAVVEGIGKIFNIHPLTLEDIVNTEQRPKFEEYDNYDVATMRMLFYNSQLHSEQLTIVLMKNMVLSFQEVCGGDAFDPVRNRIKQGKGKTRKMGADYLAYSLMDSIVDSYFTVLEKIGDKIESTDEELMNNPTPEVLKKMHEMKREMIYLRKIVWPLRELIGGMERSEDKLIEPSTKIYLRDVQDHSIRVIETVENYRDLIAGMMDIYMSSLSNKINEVMKVLTIISTLFIPLTFIVGVYGMNFDFMPELHKEWAYPAVWGVMILVVIGFLIYFRRKKWL